MDGPFRVVQPWGRDKARQASVVSTHQTVAEAVAAVNALKARMVQTGAPPDAVELVVVDAAHRIVSTTAHE
jgi:hypothetical protein